MTGVSERMLILRLRELEARGQPPCGVHHRAPVRVEYSLTEFGRAFLLALGPLGPWGLEHVERLKALP